MNAQEYCKQVEDKDLLNKKLMPTITIKENNSPLISLKDTGFNLYFETSIMENYEYLVREEIVEKIGRISKVLDKKDKILIIRSAWRSFEHQRLIWDNKVSFLKKIHPDKSEKEIEMLTSYFIAPETKSMHATGGAVDALIYDLIEICVMDFGSNDALKIDLSKKCYPYHPDISTSAKENRSLLIFLFENEDFVVDVKEFWHFDFGNAIWALEKGKLESIYDIIKR